MNIDTFCVLLNQTNTASDIIWGTVATTMTAFNISAFLSSNQKTGDLVSQTNVGWLFVFYVQSTVRSYRDGAPNYCPLRRMWSSFFYTVLTRNQNRGCRVAVHYTIAVPRKLHLAKIKCNTLNKVCFGYTALDWLFLLRFFLGLPWIKYVTATH